MLPTPVQLTFTELIRTWLLNPATGDRRHPGRRPRAARRVIAGREALHHRLRRYEAELERLRIENEDLRQSATTFGELAERLNKTLKSARP
jgi:hypothetical protein